MDTRTKAQLRHDERFLQRSCDAAAPLLLWLIWFFACYAFVALACDSILVHEQWLGMPAIRLVLYMANALALLVMLALLLRAVALYRSARRRTLLPTARVGIAALGMLGVLWTSMPAMLMAACPG